ncbi:dormancy-associated protein homolog 3 isoform X1 [Vitis vinifera]|uniref:dormancy-associated protein homolog 3 isoform X1 n=1 Tax=Vitis vinifera TaxID=29760 RepID=UPI001FC4E1AB|nr:dormancy-associated protein homolog 3 isoform X1 [Vitis vinifera]
MGLLDQLWDDTVAGPQPDHGLGKLRKYSTFNSRPTSGKAASDGGNGRSYSDDSSEEAMRVTRSIMIIKPPGFQNGSPPVSPAGSTPPVSPFSGKLAEFPLKCQKCPRLFVSYAKAPLHEKWRWGNLERPYTKVKRAVW